MATKSYQTQSTPRPTQDMTPAAAAAAVHRVAEFSIKDLPAALHFIRGVEKRLSEGVKLTRWEVADLKAFADFLPQVLDANRAAHEAAKAGGTLDVLPGAVGQVGARVVRLAMRAAGLDPKPLFDPTATAEDRELLWVELDDAAAMNEAQPAGKGGKRKAMLPPSEHEQWVFDKLTFTPQGGKAVSAQLAHDGHDIGVKEISRLCKRKAMRQRGVRNRVNVGYYIQQ